MTEFERAKSMINQRPPLVGNEQDKTQWRQYWLGFAFALVEFGIILRWQYAKLQEFIEEATK